MADLPHELSIVDKAAQIVPGRLPNFEPTNFQQLELMANVIAGSDLAPKDYRDKPQNCMVAIMMGRELGLSPIQALQGIAVINGRPGVWGDALWALVISHPEYAGCTETAGDGSHTVTLRRARKHGTDESTETFTMADAKTAGLLNREKKTPWDTYPKRMLMWRARTNAARNLFADALKGITSAEEVGDIIEGEFRSVERQTVSSSAATAAPEPAKQGGQPKPAEKPVDADPQISDEQTKQWNAAWKAAGATPTDKRAELDRMKVKRTGEMRVSQFAESMELAKTWKPAEQQPAAEQPATDEASGAKQYFATDEAPQETSAMTGREREARDSIAKLGLNPQEAQAIIAKHTHSGVGVDWLMLNSQLNTMLQKKAELP